MALPNSRSSLKDWCLRKLGSPVVNLEIEDEQIEQRLDEAIVKYQEFHYEGSEETYYKRQITASTLTFVVPASTPFQISETVSGGTSGAVLRVRSVPAGNASITFTYEVNSVPLAIGETVAGISSGASAVVASISLGDWDNQYLLLAENIIDVSQVITIGIADYGIFGFKYQYALSQLKDFTVGELVTYKLATQHLALLEDLFVGQRRYRFNRRTRKIYLDTDWRYNLEIGDYVIIQADAVLDPEVYTSIYKDEWLRDYATACIKVQWGTNVKKYSEVEIAGGMKLDGKALYDEAITEKKDLEDKLTSTYQYPTPFIVA